MRAVDNMDAYEVDDVMGQTPGLFLNDDYKEVHRCLLMLGKKPKCVFSEKSGYNLIWSLCFEVKIEFMLQSSLKTR